MERFRVGTSTAPGATSRTHKRRDLHRVLRGQHAQWDWNRVGLVTCQFWRHERIHNEHGATDGGTVPLRIQR